MCTKPQNMNLNQVNNIGKLLKLIFSRISRFFCNHSINQKFWFSENIQKTSLVIQRS